MNWMKVMASESKSRLKLLPFPWNSSAGMYSKVPCRLLTLSGLREIVKSHYFGVLASVSRMLVGLTSKCELRMPRCSRASRQEMRILCTSSPVKDV